LGKFIHAADIHLDSPLRGLERYEGAPDQIKNATRQAFENLIHLALDEEVDFLLIAGDLYDSDWRDYNTGLYFAARMNVLREAGIPVFIVRGNHDAQSVITRSLILPDNVHIFDHRVPGTVFLEHLGIAIHGQSFAARRVTENLARAYPDPEPGLINIGLLHTALDGREGHEPYAPCSLGELVNRGYDYWALGHVHRREEVRQGSPWIVFPGNLQGRHINEGGPKGCTLVSFSQGRIVAVEEYSLDVLRWSPLAVDCTGARSPEEVLERIHELVLQELELAEGRPVVFRFELVGSTPAHGELVERREHWVNQIRAVVLDASFRQGWLEKVKLHTTSPRLAPGPLPEELPRGFLEKYFRELEEDAELLDELKQELADLKAKLPHDLFVNHPDLNWDNPQVFAELLAAAKDLAQVKLTSREVGTHED